MLSQNEPNVYFSFVNCHLNYKIQLKNNYLNINNWSQKVKGLILNDVPPKLLEVCNGSQTELQ